MKNENEAKLVEKGKVKLLIVLVVMLAGVGAAFEIERAFRPQAEAFVVYYENGEGTASPDKAVLMQEKESVQPAAVEEKKAETAEAKPEMARAEAKEADEFFLYLREVEGRLNEEQRREAVLDKIETLKPQAEPNVSESAAVREEIVVYDRAGDVAQVIEDEAEIVPAADEEVLFTKEERDEAKEAALSNDEDDDETSMSDVLAKPQVSDDEEESENVLEHIENTDKIEENVDEDGAIDMMKGIIAREGGTAH